MVKTIRWHGIGWLDHQTHNYIYKMPKQTKRYLLRGVAIILPTLLLTLTSAGDLKSYASKAEFQSTKKGVTVAASPQKDYLHSIALHNLEITPALITIKWGDQIVIEEEISIVERDHPYTLDTRNLIKGDYTIVIYDMNGGEVSQQLKI